MNHLFGLIRKLIIFSLLLCTIIVVGVLYYMEYELPDIDALNTVQLQVPLQIYSHDNKLIATFGEKRRIPQTRHLPAHLWYRFCPQDRGVPGF